MTSAKYDSLVKSLADLNIGLVDSNNEFRSTYDILSDIADKWDSLSSMEQSGLAETIAGTRQQAVFFSIIEQFQEASGAMEAMAGSAGTLEESYATYLDSTTAHINQFKAAFEELGANTFDSKFISWIVDIGTAFVNFTNALVKINPLLIALPVTFGILIPKMIKGTSTIIAQNAAAQNLSATLIKEKVINDELSVSISSLTAAQARKIKSDISAAFWAGELELEEYGLMASELDLVIANEELAGSNIALGASFKAAISQFPGWGWALLGITAMVSLVGSIASSVQESNEAIKESISESLSSIGELNDYIDKIDEITNSTSSEAEQLEQLIAIKEELSEKYNIQIDDINNEADAVENLTKKLKEQTKAERENYLNQTQKQYDQAIAQVSDGSQTMNFSNLWSGLENYGTFSLKSGNFNQDLKKEKEGLEVTKEILDLFDEIPDTAIGDFKLGTNAKNEIEYFNILKSTYESMGQIIRNNKNVSEDDLKLYEKIESEYNKLYKDLKVGTEDDLTVFIPTRAKQRAQEIIDLNKQGTLSTEEWKNKLLELADDTFVADAISEIISESSKLKDVIDDYGLDNLIGQLDQVNGKLETINEAIKTANDYFEDLAKVIDNNADTDKFFSADEMIDMLDKYPELSDNILVTAYGYKFQTSALEELRKAKLEEQKTALYTQISEAEGALKSAEQELSAYQMKLKGISDLAEAELALAEVEAQLNSGKFDEGGYIYNQLNEKRARISGLVDAYNKVADLTQDVEKSKMQYTLLGTVFDDLKDSTNDATAALNNQKSALNDLKDEYKDAQDAIEDLIKLTMDMIV